MNIQTSGHLLMLSGAIHDIAEKSNEDYTKKQLMDIVGKLTEIINRGVVGEELSKHKIIAYDQKFLCRLIDKVNK